jgi:hypothetical protein
MTPESSSDCSCRLSCKSEYFVHVSWLQINFRNYIHNKVTYVTKNILLVKDDGNWTDASMFFCDGAGGLAGLAVRLSCQNWIFLFMLVGYNLEVTYITDLYI